MCSEKMASTSSNAPASIISRAPWLVSSAGWNTPRQQTGQGSAPERSSAFKASNAPSTVAEWASCPQACMTPER